MWGLELHLGDRERVADDVAGDAFEILAFIGQKLALMEEQRTMPFGAVWNRLCRQVDTPAGASWIPDVEAYEARVLPDRG